MEISSPVCLAVGSTGGRLQQKSDVPVYGHSLPILVSTAEPHGCRR